MTTITSLPSPPTTDDAVNFASRADLFFASIPNFATEVNLVAGEVNANAISAANSASAASSSASTASISANATQWISGTSYSAGQVTWSPLTFQSFRRKTAGSGTTDPSNDSTNWTRISGAGDVSLTGTETLQNKTLTRPVLTAPRENYLLLTGSGTISINTSLASVFKYTCGANTTFTINTVSAPNNQVISFILEVVNGGAYTITWPTGTKWAFGVTPGLTVSGIDIIGFYSYDQGATWRASLISKDSK